MAEKAPNKKQWDLVIHKKNMSHVQIKLLKEQESR